MERNDLVYPELSYKVVGLLYDVYNKLGYGHAEVTYQRALAVAFKQTGLQYKEQLFSPISYNGEKVGKQFFDFLVEGKVVLELKKGDHFSKTHIDQLYAYLVNSKLKLGILVYFAPRTVHLKRIVNLK